MKPPAPVTRTFLPLHFISLILREKTYLERVKKIPYSFVIDNLTGLKTLLKPMFGSYGIYSGEKILFILREKDKYPEDNGVWLATEPEHHASVREQFPSLRPIGMFDGKTSWLNLPAEASDFEESVLTMCELATKRDPRIGKIPDSKKKKKPAASKKATPKKPVKKAPAKKKKR